MYYFYFWGFCYKNCEDNYGLPDFCIRPMGDQSVFINAFNNVGKGGREKPPMPVDKEIYFAAELCYC